MTASVNTNARTRGAGLYAENLRDRATADATTVTKTKVHLSGRQGETSETLNEKDEASAMCKPARKVEPETVQRLGLAGRGSGDDRLGGAGGGHAVGGLAVRLP